jgi:hypothetical protein
LEFWISVIGAYLGFGAWNLVLDRRLAAGKSYYENQFRANRY